MTPCARNGRFRKSFYRQYMHQLEVGGVLLLAAAAFSFGLLIEQVHAEGGLDLTHIMETLR